MWDKINLYLKDETFFLAILILLVAVTSFGLGRVSGNTLIPSSQTASIVMSEFEVPEATKGASDAPAGTGERVVGSKNSDKYHLPTCSGAARISEENKVWFDSPSAAEAAGYTPAANCFK